MKNLKVSIYYYVSNKKLQNLFCYQNDTLTELAHFFDMNEIVIEKEKTESKKSYKRVIQPFIHYISNEKINILVVYGKTRISITGDLYTEFKMICKQYNVRMIAIEDIKHIMFYKIDTKCHD